MKEQENLSRPLNQEKWLAVSDKSGYWEAKAEIAG